LRKKVTKVLSDRAGDLSREKPRGVSSLDRRKNERWIPLKKKKIVGEKKIDNKAERGRGGGRDTKKGRDTGRLNSDAQKGGKGKKKQG